MVMKERLEVGNVDAAMLQDEKHERKLERWPIFQLLVPAHFQLYVVDESLNEATYTAESSKRTSRS